MLSTSAAAGAGNGSSTVHDEASAAQSHQLWVVIMGAASASAFVGSLCDLLLCSVVILRCRAHGVKPSDVYVFNLAFADLLLSAVYMPCLVAGNVLQRDIFGSGGCVFLAWLQTTALSMILLCHGALSVHWMVLTFSKDMSLMRKRGTVAAAAVVCASWLLTGGVSVTSSIGVSFSYDINFHCSHDGFNAYMLVSMAVGLVPSQVLTPLGYVVTLVRVIRFRKSISATSTSPSLAAVAHQKREYELLKSTLIMFVAFEVLYVGSIVLSLVSTDHRVTVAGQTMLYATCLVNGPLILAVNKDYRRTLSALLKQGYEPPASCR